MIAEVIGGAALAAGLVGYAGLRRKGLDRWLLPYILSGHRRHWRQFGEPTDVLLCICDHYEPKRGGVPMVKARGRVQQWLDDYPRLFDEFRDHDGRPPRHTFFYPQDEYEPELVEMVATLCRKGYGEVEIHLHHDHDTAAGLRQKLVEFKTTLHQQHGLLGRHRASGEIVYGFIHGNWALDNSRRDGRWCGVNNELDVLIETGCYADFTMPSAPSETQVRTINQLYWAVDDPLRPKSHHHGFELGRHPKPNNALLMIPGPLCLDWSKRKLRLLPGIENSNLQHNQPPTIHRLNQWLRSNISVDKHSNYIFVKLHTHGVHEPNPDVLLGPAMVEFHRTLRLIAKADPSFRVHYVTARELANIAEAIHVKSAELFDTARDFCYHPPNGFIR